MDYIIGNKNKELPTFRKSPYSIKCIEKQSIVRKKSISPNFYLPHKTSRAPFLPILKSSHEKSSLYSEIKESIKPQNKSFHIARALSHSPYFESFKRRSSRSSRTTPFSEQKLDYMDSMRAIPPLPKTAATSQITTAL
ncbi:unnamed protein product [Blepharisma stoltei]|uniref:Uncharacterized protein n=1 Tax=Blepharisma stoltei TaxID=1481888 RepID=A0AAU9ITJ1_9CILI|nr:unnamed protein product [Blepharisma stoltei]